MAYRRPAGIARAAVRPHKLKLTRSVNIGAVLDGHDCDAADLILDHINHAIVAAPLAVQAYQTEPQWLSDTPWIFGQRSVDELYGCGRYLLR